MAPSGSLSYVFVPLMAFAAVGVLALVLRWAYARGGSLVQRPARRGRPDDYGLLVPVLTPAGSREAEEARRRLALQGVRVTVTETADGPRVLVFEADAERARGLLAQPPPS